MFGFFLDVASAVVSAVIPIYRTWKVLKSRKTTQLVPLAKYWITFGLITMTETVANALYIPYILPGYSFLKFGAVLYLYTGGYNHLYDNLISPFLTNKEPIAARALSNATEVGGRMVGQFIRETVQYTLLAVSANNGLNLTAARAINPAMSISERFVEVQEECEIIYPPEIKDEVMDETAPEQQPEEKRAKTSDAAGDSDEVEVLKQKKTRRSSRTRKARK